MRDKTIECINKPELVKFMANRKGYTIKGASEAIADVFECVEELLIDHKCVNIHGFGKFVVRQRMPKMVWDFKNNKQVVPTKPTWILNYFPSVILKREIKEGYKET